MSESFKLANAPIVEAVLDIDCDMPPNFDLPALETALRDSFRATYPKLRQQLIQEHKIEAHADAPAKVSSRHSIQAFHFLHGDEKQLVQMRTQGFSFNRLAPYGSLDDYLPEIERTWNLFRTLTSPVLVRVVRLRYINRILIPCTDGTVKLGDYIKNSPQIPDETNLSITGFLNQRIALEKGTGHEANMVMTMQPLEGDKLPLIFDNCVAAGGSEQPENWPWILGEITSLRDLKNRIFRNTLTTQCLNLFQHSESVTSQGLQP